ncbi:MAG: aminotransferase class I/II-fold pyridoxal phosphate-dependent enzyme [Polyangiaceae bacterium]|nr:aminotransferase class I/II-fold pyridoxal phosphate-dependent enzyme [Polyangiaceae bacterium]
MLHLVPGHQGRPTEDPIFALNREANARIARGESVVNATIGAAMDDDGKLAVLPTAARAVHEVEGPAWAGYAPISGSPAFLQAVVAGLFATEPLMREVAIATATPGGTGALRHALANFLEPGQSLLTTSFFWGPYQTLADEAGCKVETFNMFTAGGALDVEALDAALGRQLATQKRVLFFLNDPCHNPTGYSMSQPEWRALTECLVRRSAEGPITLLVDTAYLAYSAGDPRAFLKELHPLLGKVMLLFAWSASKTFTMYGLRVGAIVACVPDAKERATTEAAFSYSCRGTWSNCNAGGLLAITRLLTDDKLKAAVDAERDALKKTLFSRVNAFNQLAKPKGLRYPRYEGGFFVTVFRDNATEHAARMRERGVFVVPQKGALRVALCSAKEADVARLVDALAE